MKLTIVIIAIIVTSSCITVEESFEFEVPSLLDGDSVVPTKSCYMTDEKMLCIINNLDTCLYWDDVECVKGVFESCEWYINIDLWIEEFDRRGTPK